MSTTATHLDTRAGRVGPLRVGWVLLLMCAVLAVALFFASVVVWRLACGGAPAYESGPHCTSSLNDIVTVTVPAAILVLVIAGVLAGLICGFVVITRSAAYHRRLGGIWLAASAAVYAGTVLIRAANPVMPDLPLLSQIPYIAIQGAGVLIVWLVVTGTALLVARAIRRVSSAR